MKKFNKKPESYPRMNSDGLRIRKLEEEDLVELEWGGQFTHFRNMYRKLYEDSQAGKTLMWVAEKREVGVIGQIFMQLQIEDSREIKPSDCAYIFGFRIKEHFRNNGIGTQLLSHAESVTMKNGLYRTILHVAKANRTALRFDERCGYRIFGATPGRWTYIDHNGLRKKINEPSWRMEKSL